MLVGPYQKECQSKIKALTKLIETPNNLIKKLRKQSFDKQTDGTLNEDERSVSSTRRPLFEISFTTSFGSLMWWTEFP